QGLCRTLAVAVSAITLLWTAHPASAQATNEDPRSVEVRRIIADIQASGPSASTDGELAEPEGEPPDPHAPAVALRTVLSQLEAVRSQGQIPPPLATSIKAASVQVAKAYDEFAGDEPDLDSVVHHIRRAVHVLEEAGLGAGPSQELLRPPKLLLTASARWMAAQLIDRTVAGGVSERRVKAARAALARGDQLLAQGHLAQAVGQFGNTFTVGDTLVFDIELFEQNIKDALDGQTVGYAYSIGLGGVLATQGASGLARAATDPPETDQSPTKDMNIASVSKTITAVAILKLLEDKGVAIGDSVAPFLPPEWDPHPSIDDLTFEDLLTQESGLNGNVSTGFGGQLFTALQASVEQGIDPADKTYFYQNQNFSLLRVILPYLWDINPQTFGESLDVVTAAIYLYFVQTEVFAPMGFTAECKPTGSAPTLAYTFPFDGVENGFDNDGDWSLACGAGGWHLSANELAAFLAHLRFNPAILSPATRDLMDDNFLGWLDPANGFSWGNGAFGLYHNHGGDYWGPGGSGGPGVRSCFMDFHIAVQASVLINSRSGNHPQQCQLLTDAFDNAWVDSG
ncbi:MAG: serine hydrolase domain-containing protein, partial [bacterium]